MTQLWDPSHVDDNKKKIERKTINDNRIELIKTLRKKYGTNFIGGLRESKYSKKYYSDLIVDKQFTNKNNYLKIIKTTDICITTTGLEGSFGWKFAEYVAASRAIVSEKSNF